MTDHLDVPTVATGDWIDAAWLNQYIGDNFRAIFQGLATGGDVPYALDANTVAALGIGGIGSLLKSTGSIPAWLASPAGLSLLQNDGTGALSWLGAGPAYKFLRVNAAGNGFEFVAGGASVTYHSNATSYSYDSAAWRDMPNSSKVVTLAVQSTIACIGIMEHHATDSPNYYGFLSSYFNIDGTDISWAPTNKSYGATQLPIPIVGMKANVPAGDRTIKIREYCGAGSYEVFYKHYLIFVLPEG